MGLNENGMKVWKHKFSRNLFAQQSYEWNERVIVLEELGQYRNFIAEFNVNDISTDWIPMTQNEYSRVTSQFKEIYDGSK